MKYGILTHIGFSKQGEDGNRLMSMGDVLECLAIERIYQSIGVDYSELEVCYPYELENYDGEYVVLPINVYALNIKYSTRILPVFLGLTLGGEHALDEKELHVLRRFAPIGCRDERTLRRMLDSGIDAYFAGCVVATFPERKQNLPSQNKVFFVDAQEGIKEYIPKELLENHEFISHDFYMTYEEVVQGKSLAELGEKQIEMYSKEAKLIITSKFHAAVLALALGIPVILTMENNYYKYTWITKFIPLYEPKDFCNINWAPEKVVISAKEKELMFNISARRIKETYDKYKDLCELSELRENVEIKEFSDIFYGSYAIEYMKKNWSADIAIEYCFWGATQTAITLFNYIQENYPNAKLKTIYDFSVRNKFLGIIPESLDEIECCSNELFIFVTGNSASEAAKELFHKIGRPENTFFLCERKILREEQVGDK